MDKEQARQKIEELASRFSSLAEEYKSTTYNEAQTRQDFINPFFKAFGWDVDNVNEYSQSYSDVIHEDKVEVDGISKTPDYSFLIGGKRVFSVESKKPHVNKFWIALINSKLINFYYRHRFERTHLATGYLRFDIPYLKELPIKKIKLANKKNTR